MPNVDAPGVKRHLGHPRRRGRRPDLHPVTFCFARRIASSALMTQSCADEGSSIGLTTRIHSVDHERVMRRKVIGTIIFYSSLAAGVCAHAQDASKTNVQDNPKKNAPTQEEAPTHATKRLTVQVTGGEKNVPVENASVYLKFSEGRALRKDRKYALNVKTNREGVARIPDPPEGRVLIQIVAEGWKTYGKYYDLADPGAVISIHLDRPPKWY